MLLSDTRGHLGMCGSELGNSLEIKSEMNVGRSAQCIDEEIGRKEEKIKKSLTFGTFQYSLITT